MFLAIEFCLTVVCAAVALVRPEIGEAWFSAVERRFSAFAQKRTLAVASVGLMALILRVALLPILPLPEPEVHDEYSHLLLADTLAHGRLANPTHPMWQHFETFHENMRPTYASMYYPGYALFLAFGQVVMGHPFWGVWLSSGLMCAAICWALQGWMPPGWALLGGGLAVIRLGTFSYWVDSYWGGTVAALGGALVLGALPRIKATRRVRDAGLLAVGMAVLAWTRPYEGMFFCVPILIVLLWWMIRGDSPPLKVSVVRIVLPVVLVMALAFAGLGYYFWRVTGSPFTTPYQVNIRTYGLVYFPWQKIGEVPKFHHAVMEGYYRGPGVVGLYRFARLHPVRLQLLKQLAVWLFYFGPVLTLPWLAWVFTRPRCKFWQSFSGELRLLLVLCVVTWASLALTIYIGQPHYAAPMTAVFYATTLLVMRDIWGWQSQGQCSGKFLVRSLSIVCLILFVFRVSAPALQITPPPSWLRTWCSEDLQNLERAKVLQQLENTPGNHLVIVRYSPTHNLIFNEWVFNGADIDGSKVIWARDMGDGNAELLQYFNARKVWLVEPDYNPPKLSPYVQ